ncbi:paraquat-inducible protein A [Neiella marina]|uniref:Paraquat-inducible protein A n=1 Tax=Neiella holothuriorum TaxID=2870530 RepID=A0ABS7EDR1_9GAMM|nr:paraquat-inducible protein A [Neiella holothuriorum]MBW8190465.1 paraquat-inducible protein A [Neiella holothuriorum]
MSGHPTSLDSATISAHEADSEHPVAETPAIAQTACEECDHVIADAVAEAGDAVHCPRCHHHISVVHTAPAIAPLAYASAAIMMLIATLMYSFMSFSSAGHTVTMDFAQTLRSLVSYGYNELALLLFVTLVIFPIGFLLITVYLHGALLFKLQPIFVRPCLLMLGQSKHWLMVDVFLIGILVSLVKVMGMADVGFGLSFWAFCLFTVLLVKTTIVTDLPWLWQQLVSQPKPVPVENKHPSALRNGFQLCHYCGNLNAVGVDECPRCDHKVHARKDPKLDRVLALLIASMVLYIPANILPIMDTSLLGGSDPATIMGGVILLWQLKSYPVAMVIFIASVMVPLAKMVAIAWLAYVVKSDRSHDPKRQLKLYRMTEFVGRWSMIDVFVVAILAALIRIDGLIAIYPGPATVSFAGVVILTMISAMSFDPRLIWDDGNSKETSSS